MSKGERRMIEERSMQEVVQFNFLMSGTIFFVLMIEVDQSKKTSLLNERIAPSILEKGYSP
jgi:hypothetical protein